MTVATNDKMGKHTYKEETPEGTGKVKQISNYSGWLIDHSNRTAVLCNGSHQLNWNIEKDITLQLQESGYGSHLEAWWPSPPLVDPSFAIAGCCLWDARWQIEFSRLKKRNEFIRRRISNKYDRKDAICRIRRGEFPSRFYIPTGLGKFHHEMLSWQATKLKQWKGSMERIFYNTPVSEYLLYIQELENEFFSPHNVVQSAKSVPNQIAQSQLPFVFQRMKERLREFSDLVRDELEKQLGADLFERVTFIYPMEEFGARNAQEAHMIPYVVVEQLGADRNKVVGLEDLPANYPSRQAETITGFKVPVLGLVHSTPHPFHTKSLIYGQFEVIELQSSDQRL